MARPAEWSAGASTSDQVSGYVPTAAVLPSSHRDRRNLEMRSNLPVRTAAWCGVSRSRGEGRGGLRTSKMVKFELEMRAREFFLGIIFYLWVRDGVSWCPTGCCLFRKRGPRRLDSAKGWVQGGFGSSEWRGCAVLHQSLMYLFPKFRRTPSSSAERYLSTVGLRNARVALQPSVTRLPPLPEW